MAIAETLLANKLQVAIAGMVVFGGAGATYVALGGDIPFLNQDGMADQVPEDVDMVMYMDPGVAEDTTTKELVNGLIDISKDQQGELYTGPDDYEEMLDETDSNSSLDMENLNSVMLYGKYPDAGSEDTETTSGLPEDSYVGFIIDSEWGEEEFMEETEGNGTEYEEGDYEGYTIYEQQDVPDGESKGYIGVLAEGQYVIGTEDAVKDAIDVDRGEMNAFGGDLRKAYDDTRSGDSTYLKFAATFPEEERLEEAGGESLGSDEQFETFTNISVMSGSYYTTDDESIGMQMRLEAGSESEAEDLDSVISAGLVFVKGSAPSEESKSLIDEVEVEQDGSAVKMTFESEVESIIGAWEATLEATSGSGSETGGDSGFGSDSDTSAIEPSTEAAVPA
ncbi:hypothetical protein [Halorientalis salina]|uniref:hypothetical protein n=1 Tax=Halorientalis salina TaxID=2932266 RepID=UPI0010AB771C|nr:hypothetical protein [Halorientalis salina]